MRIHFLRSETPVVEGRSYEVLCGLKLPNVVTLDVWECGDSEPQHTFVATSYECAACRKVLVVTKLDSWHRIYALGTGEETKHQETA